MLPRIVGHANALDLLMSARRVSSEEALRIAFIMSGQGPQWWGMGRELMEREPVFRAAIERVTQARPQTVIWGDSRVRA